MRLRWGIPLPGPFYLSGPVRTRRPRRPGCLPFIGLALLLGAADKWWWVWLVAAGVAIMWAVAWSAQR